MCSLFFWECPFSCLAYLIFVSIFWVCKFETLLIFRYEVSKEYPSIKSILYMMSFNLNLVYLFLLELLIKWGEWVPAIYLCFCARVDLSFCLAVCILWNNTLVFRIYIVKMLMTSLNWSINQNHVTLCTSLGCRLLGGWLSLTSWGVYIGKLVEQGQFPDPVYSLWLIDH